MNLLRSLFLALTLLSQGFACASATTIHAVAVPAVHTADLQNRLDALVQRARPGIMGVAVVDVQSGMQWKANAEHAFPMMSVFKAPLAAAVLDRVARGDLSMDQNVIVKRSDLEIGPLKARFHGEQMRFTVRELLTDAVSKSDNTAADALLKLVGGPTVVTAFLRKHGIDGMHVDLGESGIGTIFSGLKPPQQPPANETDAQELVRLQRGYDAYLVDPRNRSTPDAAANFLGKLWRKELLSPASTQLLIDLMAAQTTPSRLRAGLPAGVRLADKCGTSYTLQNKTAAFNDIGILIWPDGHAVIIAAFLTASTASTEERTALFSDLTRDVTTALHP